MAREGAAPGSGVAPALDDAVLSRLSSYWDHLRLLRLAVLRWRQVAGEVVAGVGAGTVEPARGAARLEGCALAVERIREQLALLSSPDGAWTLAGMADVVSSVEWARAGGPDECPHGYAAGIPCPRCAGGGGS